MGDKKFKVLKLYYNGMPATTICSEYHIPHSTLYKWIKNFPKDNLPKQKPTSMSKIMSHTKKIESELAFLRRTVIRHLPLRDRMKIIDDEYGKESLHVQCDALGVNRGTYLNHKKRGKNDNAWFKKREAEYAEIIYGIYEESGHIYGARKIAAIMRKKGKSVSERFVHKIMAESGWRSERSASKKDYQLVARHLRKAAHSSQELKTDNINQVWVSDTSPLSVHNRYYYICAYIDLHSRKVVSCNVGRNNSTQLTKRTFMDAYKDRKPKELIIHTDNGSCYSSYSFNQKFQELGVEHSYSRPHTPHDNAVAESFFNTLKREAIFLNGYPKSLRELKQLVSKYIEKYNSTRPHEHLRYSSPDEFEKEYSKNQNVDKR